MRIAISLLFIAHGVAHLVGFVVPWKLMSTAELPYRTTVLGGVLDVGDSGARAVGIAWLVTALAFILIGPVMIVGGNVRTWTFVVLTLSVVLCVIGWPDTRIGLAVNALLFGALLVAP
jgi:hypothetical protein